MDLKSIVRKNIWELKPYSSARNEFQGKASVFLDANENPNDTGLNRYPDPLQQTVKQKISEIKNVSTEQIFLGNGSDEPIDLVYRAFCEPRIDNVVAIEPTYGMYRVCADINNVEYRPVLLDSNFKITAQNLLAKTDKNTKAIWCCSPNNPTGNLLNKNEIESLLQQFKGIVVIDEAYIDFTSQTSFLCQLDKYQNLIVLQTLSKAWGSAAIRLGMAFASPQIIQILTKIKYPYNINILTQRQALKILENEKQIRQWTNEIIRERKFLNDELSSVPIVEKIYPSDANFLLVKVTDADTVYRFLTEKGIIVRNRNSIKLCGNSLRITVGLHSENMQLIEQLKKFDKDTQLNRI